MLRRDTSPRRYIRPVPRVEPESAPRRPDSAAGDLGGPPALGGAHHVVHPQRELRNVRVGEEAHFEDLHRVLRLRGRHLHVAFDHDRHGVEARIPVGRREDADDPPRDDTRDADLFLHLPREPDPKRLPPLERPSGERPRARVGATDEHPLAVGRPCGGGDPHHGAPEHEAGGLLHDVEHALRETRERSERHGRPWLRLRGDGAGVKRLPRAARRPLRRPLPSSRDPPFVRRPRSRSPC